MPKRKPQPRKRKLPPGVTGLAEHKEKKREKEVKKARDVFMTLPREERIEQLKGAIQIRTSWPKPPEKK